MAEARDDIFSVWAPAEAPWSAWVKPVLFAHAGEATNPDEMDLSTTHATAIAAATLGPDTAIVIDLPGAAGVWAGLAAAARGWRPVPLYIAAPAGPTAPAVVAVRPIIDALVVATLALADLQLPLDAPPAFLLDADRRYGAARPGPGVFDNRSMSFPTDFPSAAFLQSRGIQRAVLVQMAGTQPQEDLAHTLRRWQEAGISLSLVRAEDHAGSPMRLDVPRPSAFRAAWRRALALLRFRRGPLGGFGGLTPEAGAAG